MQLLAGLNWTDSPTSNGATMEPEDEEDRKVAQAFDAHNERRYEEHLEEKEQEEKEKREREDEVERSSDDSDYVYDTDEETEGWTSEEEDYPEIEDFRAVEARGERDGLEPYDKDSLYNFRRYHVRQMMHHVRAFDEGRTIHRTFCDLWFKTHARLQGFLPRDLTNKEGTPDDPWVIAKGELELLVRLGTPAASGMADEGFERDMDGWEEAVAYAPEELSDRVDVEFKAPECVWPKNYCHGNWNGL